MGGREGDRMRGETDPERVKEMQRLEETSLRNRSSINNRKNVG